jgi:hypothetical protein
MRRYIPGFLLLLAASAPLTLGGCTDLINKLKGGGVDAGTDGEVVAAPEADGAVVAAPDPDAAVEPAPTVTPTGTLTAVTPTATATVRPTTTDAGVKADAAAPADAGAKADSGAAPAPTPTLKIPTFDAGGFPAIRFDAGGFRPPWQPK